MLQTFTVPNPNVGADWLWTVPGQYQARIISITATLNSHTNPSTLVDSSGNGWNLTEGSQGHGSYGVAGPYGGGANNRGASGDGSSVVQHLVFGDSAADASWALANWSVDFWMNLAQSGVAGGYIIVMDAPVSPSSGWEFLTGITAGSPTDARVQVPSVGNHTFATDVVVGAWHHYGMKWDGVNVTYYFDGANIAASNAVLPTTGPTMRITLGGGQFNPMMHGSLAAVAIYPAALADARFAAHAGAGATQANYKAAVLADTPKGFWLLDELTSTVQRTVSLRITNGVRTLALFPGFTGTSTSGTFLWSWTAQSPGNAQNPDQTVTQIVIADELLEPGYTVSAFTPDLGSGDQWSNITVLADVTDSGGPPPPSSDKYLSPDGYLNAMLVPEYP